MGRFFLLILRCRIGNILNRKTIKRITLIIAAILFVVAVVVNVKFQIFPIHFLKGGEPNLTILTWNIHDTGANYQQRQKGIAEEIIRQDVDIVALHEYYGRISGELNTRLRKKYPYSNDRFSNTSAGAILYSRYPIIKATQICAKGTKPQAYAYCVMVNGKKVRIVSCHLMSTNNMAPEHRYTLEKKSDLKTLPTYFKNYLKAQKIRTKEASAIAEHIQSELMPTIVLGDMNDFSGSPVLGTLQTSGLKNAWWEGGTGFGVTFREGWMRFRLDHILYDSNYELSSIDVVQSDLSDHMPLVGKFILR